jgi:hypothetical protein
MARQHDAPFAIRHSRFDICAIIGGRRLPLQGCHRDWRLIAIDRRQRGIISAPELGMTGLHSANKGQREVIRQLVHSVLVRDMGSFNPERFKEWVKATDVNFRKAALTLKFRIHDRVVHFEIKELRTGRTAFRFSSSTHVAFGDRDVVMSVEEYGQRSY